MKYERRRLAQPWRLAERTAGCFSDHADTVAPRCPAERSSACSFSGSAVVAILFNTNPSIQSFNTILQYNPSIQSFNTILQYNPSIQSFNTILQYNPSIQSFNTILQYNPSI